MTHTATTCGLHPFGRSASNREVATTQRDKHVTTQADGDNLITQQSSVRTFDKLTKLQKAPVQGNLVKAKVKVHLPLGGLLMREVG
eukprot:CAMPEP_0206530942 /NCGR_PEP_ID=MMETSP0325_2-20121206/3478_1 /ASSEMBLY_ACC=CAM_ASM_000347 /TAXON_ID=2866 /ORGANISM="Crypthecodinium cohnii, Strain Seligo" /LENGTH=85 /DNA_ID=CAMNT_0054027107 /DNA_START=15 /DNA_END=268 /DNA_ORIENTATION=-